MSAPHQHTRPGHDLRVLRTAVFAAVCVVLAAAGHALASLATIPLWTLGVGFLWAALVAAPFTGRARSMPGVVALLAVGQTALHTLFGLGQHTSTTAAASGAAAPVSDASLVEHAARFVCGATAAQLSPAEAQRILTDARVHPDLTGHAVAHHPADAMSAAAGSSAALLPSLSMLLGHVLAAVVAGWLLRRGDLALLRLLELPALSAHTVAEGALVRSLRGALALTRALYAGLPGVPRTGPALPSTALLAPPELRTTALQHTVVRRGPPAEAFALAA